jgi:hypothetical protein
LLENARSRWHERRGAAVDLTNGHRTRRRKRTRDALGPIGWTLNMSVPAQGSLAIAAEGSNPPVAELPLLRIREALDLRGRIVRSRDGPFERRRRSLADASVRGRGGPRRGGPPECVRVARRVWTGTSACDQHPERDDVNDPPY